MDNKKQFLRQNTNSKACQPIDSNRKSSDTQVTKAYARNSRRREQNNLPRNDQQRNLKQPAAKLRPNVDKRPRVRGGFGKEDDNNYNHDSTCPTDDLLATSTGLAENNVKISTATGAISKYGQNNYDLNSVYNPGSKKQSLNHLLNFHYTPRESEHYAGNNFFGRGVLSGNNHANAHANKKQKYNKEQFLQANFQFVIKSSAKPKFDASPDTLIDWKLIEQINIQTTEEPQCPICLYPPVGAKLTRCGHVYCWPCILHYLALSDKTWRKCPICYEAIHKDDLKSTVIIQQHQINIGENVQLQLMRRKKGSMFIEKYTTNAESVERYPQFSKTDEKKLFSKFLIANRFDILSIIEREEKEIMADNDTSCPEFIFVQTALQLIKERREQLGDFLPKQETEFTDMTTVDETQETKVSLTDNLNENTDLQTNINPIEAKFIDDEIQEEIKDDMVLPTLEDTDFETLELSSVSNSDMPSSPSTTKYYYFYQSVDGQNIYLHPINVKMLQACYGTLDKAPQLINARILQKEHHSMDEEHRRKFTCLRHLPLTCQFAVVEVELNPPIVSEGILKLFKNDILYRKKERERREREEIKREKKINEINERQMGKLIARTATLNLSSPAEFPAWDFKEELSVTNSTANTVVASSPTPKHQTSYSAVAEVGKANKQTNNFVNRNIGVSSIPAAEVDEGTTGVSRLNTQLGDVLAEAMAQKKQHNAATNGGATGNKKKKAKKMLPLFSTGINYKGT
ncbi:RING finger protein 10 [Teleopsis dalmanni]|uniref:RING finger protein 10 n=1 Tax=Teleopsis dalmanni TaxID=139649 RepID=UPI0018CE365E|nr:RING finger protein 10 [Teleopsis dalmanni]